MSYKNKCQNCLRYINNSDNFCPACGTKIIKIDNCPICLEDKRVEITPCGHKVCLECIPNLKKNNKCHICRKTLIGWKDTLIPNLSNTLSSMSSNITNYSYTPEQNYNSGIVNQIERTHQICSKCNSRNIVCHQIDGKYCNNCKQYLSNFKIVRESELENYPEIDKELVNPTIKNVCPHCLSDNIKITGPQWDIMTSCNNCGRNIKNIRKIKLRDWVSMF